jgi:hypothetical protein
MLSQPRGPHHHGRQLLSVSVVFNLKFAEVQSEARCGMAVRQRCAKTENERAFFESKDSKENPQRLEYASVK